MPMKATRVSPGLTEAEPRSSDRSGPQPSGRATAGPEADADDVVIIGAGPAGLTAAFVLAGKGRTSTVLEADDTVGGISRTVERDGWRFDVGGHRFFTKVKAVEDLWHEILPGEELMVRPRLSRIYYQGKYYEYPLKPLNALRNLGPGGVASLRGVLCVGARAPASGPKHVRGLGGSALRLAPVPTLLQDVHGESLGLPRFRTASRLGRTADQEPQPFERRDERTFPQKGPAGDHDSDRPVRIPAPRSRDDVGTLL